MACDKALESGGGGHSHCFRIERELRAERAALQAQAVKDAARIEELERECMRLSTEGKDFRKAVAALLLAMEGTAATPKTKAAFEGVYKFFEEKSKALAEDAGGEG